LASSHVETVVSLCIGHVNLPPRQRQENASMITMNSGKSHQDLFARQMFKRAQLAASIQDRSKNTQPSNAVADLRSARASAMARRAKATSSAQGSADHLLLDDPPAEFFHDRVTASTKLRNKSGLAADEHPEIRTKRSMVQRHHTVEGLHSGASIRG